MTFVQDFYPDSYAHCHGCGRHNAHGLHIRTEWIGGEGVCHFTPWPEHIAVPGFVYGGLTACLVDCHSIATAAAAAMTADGLVPCRDETPRFVTGSLQVDYLKPTPMGVELVLRSRATDIGPRKVTVETRVMAGDVEVARGRTLAVRLPTTMASPST